jgi:hypothetical protein
LGQSCGHVKGCRLYGLKSGEEIARSRGWLCGVGRPDGCGAAEWGRHSRGVESRGARPDGTPGAGQLAMATFLQYSCLLMRMTVQGRSHLCRNNYTFPMTRAAACAMHLHDLTDMLPADRGEPIYINEFLTWCRCPDNPRAQTSSVQCRRARQVRVLLHQFPSPTMCHGHPHHHSCGHQSVTWHYCPSSLTDLETGYKTPCADMTFAASQSSTANCPRANCDFRSAGGGEWTCCKCGRRNTSGRCCDMSPEPWGKNPARNEWTWIESCDHGCCRGCGKDGKFAGYKSTKHS